MHIIRLVTYEPVNDESSIFKDNRKNTVNIGNSLEVPGITSCGSTTFK
jgi:hypothetical protein